ncbi:latrophilin-like protein 1 [Diadema setosum]|uniref:latrophilin-like protein 1 n=1 Tax=Diadema setosum TaxID=31175 RepID=UPI003B3A7697
MTTSTLGPLGAIVGTMHYHAEDHRFYVFFQQDMTWFEAYNYCQTHEGEIVSYENKTEEEDVGMLRRNIFKENSRTFWTSARYHAIDGDWKWSPSNVTFPDVGDITGERGECLAYKATYTQFQIVQSFCNSSLPFMCEWPYAPMVTQCRCPLGYNGPYCEIEPVESANPPASPVGTNWHDRRSKCEGLPFQVTCVTTQQSNKRIRIEYAAFGRFEINDTVCEAPTVHEEDTNCVASTSLLKTTAQCNGKPYCDLDPGIVFFQSIPCKSTKYLEVRYRCGEDDAEIYNAPYFPALSAAPVMYCDQVVVGAHTWMRTREDTVAIHDCPDGYIGQIKYDCEEGGSWAADGPDDSSCRVDNEENQLFLNIVEGDKLATEFASDVLNFISDPESGGATAEGTVEILSVLTTVFVTQETESDGGEQVNAVDEFAKSSSQSITQVMEDVTQSVADQLAENITTTVTTENIDMTCGSIPIRVKPLSYPSDDVFEQVASTKASVVLPASSFDIGCDTGEWPPESMNITGNVSCIFYVYGDEDGSGYWSSEGCRVVESNRSHTKCACNHLTNFAILLDVTGVYTEIPAVHNLALELLTLIGCSISIACLAVSIFAFSFFKSLWNTRTTIHRNLCISLLVAELLFLVGVERTENKIACSVIAGLIHYSFLCAFAWMFLEGIQLYIMLVHVFSTNSKVFPYYLAGYGVPAVIVAIAAGVTQGSGYGTDMYCWLSTDRGFIWSFAGPVALIIVVNLVFMVVSLRVAYSGRAAVSKDATSSQDIKVWIKGAVTLTFLLGSTWVIGFMNLAEGTLPLAYAFTILNSLQGLFIFIYHCLGNERVKKEMAKLLLRQKWLPSWLRVRLEPLVPSTTSTYSTQQSSVDKKADSTKTKKTDSVALTDKKDAVHPVAYVQDIDVSDEKPHSWLYDKSGVLNDRANLKNDVDGADYY